MWLARDKDLNLYLFNEKPNLYEWIDNRGRQRACWETATLNYSEYALELPRALYQNVTFENSPVEVELKIINKTTL